MLIINWINAHPNDPSLPAPPASPPPYYDVSDSDGITALDVLLVINYINSHPTASGEGERPSAGDGGEAALVRTRTEPRDLVFTALGQDDRFGLDELVPFPASKFRLRRPRVGGSNDGIGRSLRPPQKTIYPLDVKQG